MSINKIEKKNKNNLLNTGLEKKCNESEEHFYGI